ncbi:hypothetical protein [Hymenobacter rubripertinctus]|uniref:Uncharacterized protein n=1 Tax=Hymenobacter rubripertinctus TaxID=2029981 RepID=A0A418QYK5_9BACT|nr:hypothetical protein [Hymenobacter rubripertinctus]RIY10245.1 hypothetical protein D0T11_10355 [Hymenobacter rubripertinctus]
MPDTTLIAEPYGSMLLAAEVPCLIVQWHGFANRQQFQSLMDRGLALYMEESRRTRPLGWLADTRLVSAVTPDDQQWLRTNWNPRAHAAGIRHVSFVSPESVFGQMSVQGYTANTAAADAYAIDVAHHRTLPEAKRWLRQALQELAAG